MKKELSEKLKNVSPSMTLELSALAKRLKAQGKDIVSFGIGEPDFAVEGIIKAALIDAVNRDMSHYTDTKGITELREMIADRLKKQNGINVGADQIITCCGAKQAISTALTVLCSSGDEVIIPAPYWVSYSEMVKIVGAVPVIVQTKWENGFLMTPDELSAAVTPRTKALLL
nr:aminotransferase class I/II-fold pyridoxal phosphate-dependent enzyme [Eubacteriales bacterium]